MVLCLLPEDLDHIELGAVGREVAQDDLMLSHPAPRDVVIQAMMDFGVIQNNEGTHGLGNVGQKIIHKGDERLPIDGADDLLVIKPLACKIKGSHHRDTLMVGRRDRMGQPYRRPSALHGRRGREPGFIVVEQLTFPVSRQVLESGKVRLAGGKSYGVAVFFRLNRVRLKLNPLARSRTLRTSSEQGSGQ